MSTAGITSNATTARKITSPDSNAAFTTHDGCPPAPAIRVLTVW